MTDTYKDEDLAYLLPKIKETEGLNAKRQMNGISAALFLFWQEQGLPSKRLPAISPHSDSRFSFLFPRVQVNIVFFIGMLMNFTTHTLTNTHTHTKDKSSHKFAVVQP